MSDGINSCPTSTKSLYDDAEVQQMKLTILALTRQLAEEKDLHTQQIRAMHTFSGELEERLAKEKSTTSLLATATKNLLLRAEQAEQKLEEAAAEILSLQSQLQTARDAIKHRRWGFSTLAVGAYIIVSSYEVGSARSAARYVSRNTGAKFKSRICDLDGSVRIERIK